MWANNGGQNQKPEVWWVNPRGYIEGRIRDGSNVRHVKKHRLVAETIIGRPLLDTEDVHHIDGNKQNNDPSNLEILDHGVHSTHHNLERHAALRKARGAKP